MQQTFGSFLAEHRKANNLTQHALAEQLFVSESAVSKWEKDVARPDISLLPKLAELLGVTEHELITASIDNTARMEKAQAKRWRALTLTLYVVPRFIKTKNPYWQLELEQSNPFNADFSVWTVANDMIEKNVHYIIFLTLLSLAIVFFAVGIIRHTIKKSKV